MTPFYIVIEAQQTGDAAPATLINTYTDLNQAWSKYHLILSAAAVSSVDRHGAYLLTSGDEMSRILDSQIFEHEKEEE